MPIKKAALVWNGMETFIPPGMNLPAMHRTARSNDLSRKTCQT